MKKFKNLKSLSIKTEKYISFDGFDGRNKIQSIIILAKMNKDCNISSLSGASVGNFHFAGDSPVYEKIISKVATAERVRFSRSSYINFDFLSGKVVDLELFGIKNKILELSNINSIKSLFFSNCLYLREVDFHGLDLDRLMIFGCQKLNKNNILNVENLNSITILGVKHEFSLRMIASIPGIRNIRIMSSKITRDIDIVSEAPWVVECHV